jgi:hypothetical protein
MHNAGHQLTPARVTEGQMSLGYHRVAGAHLFFGCATTATRSEERIKKAPRAFNRLIQQPARDALFLPSPPRLS